MSRRAFLAELLARKREEVARSHAAGVVDRLRELAAAAPPPRSLGAVLSPSGGATRVIAEVKRASPSVGSIRELDPAVIARAYVRGGAAAISVLTDAAGFGGSLDDLRAVREAVAVPLLRKDFILDPVQLLEARAAGADAVLLIVAALDPTALRGLTEAAAELGLEALVEVHTGAELDRARAAGARLIGINHRDLGTFEVDLGVSERLLPGMRGDEVVVCESGIRGPADVARLRAAGAANFLVGEALVRADDPGRLLETLRGAR